jgi:hypothetical protein
VHFCLQLVSDCNPPIYSSCIAAITDMYIMPGLLVEMGYC